MLKMNWVSKYSIYILIFLAVISGMMTYASLAKWPPAASEIDRAIILLYIDLGFLCIFGFIVVRHLVRLANQRRQGLAGAKLHERIIRYLLMLVMVPTIFVAIFSAVFFNLGIDGWFNERIQNSLENARLVAKAYRDEHIHNVESEIKIMAGNLSQNANLAYNDQNKFIELLRLESIIRSFPEVALYNKNGVIMSNGMAIFSPLDLTLVTENPVADEWNPIISIDSDRVQAIVKLKGFLTDVHLIARRMIDPKVLNYIEKTNATIVQYQAFEENRYHIQLVFSLMFLVVALVIMMSTIWVGILFASRITQPISELILASENIMAGNLSSRVEVSKHNDELRLLGRSFNEMTSKIESQQATLLETNEALAERNRFTETVLRGVSTGVIGLDENGMINLPNRRASALLGIDLGKHIGSEFAKLFQPIKSMLRLARRRPEEILESQIDWVVKGIPKRLLIRISVEKDQGEVKGFVVNFDDISELVAAQKKSAWADIARRIAHEIKNPLTPIQLSAERLKRKYSKEIKTSPEVFSNCTDIIVRQVEDIGQMVDEFSAFAKMPGAKLAENNLTEICDHVFTLQKNAHPEIGFVYNVPKKKVMTFCDDRLIRQLLINIYQNAIQAIEEKVAKSGDFTKCIKFYLEQKSKEIIIEVWDNGIGLNEEVQNNLTEPYVTTKEKGTGLGLAIVQRIVEDHNGRIEFRNHDEGGVCVTLTLPKR